MADRVAEAREQLVEAYVAEQKCMDLLHPDQQPMPPGHPYGGDTDWLGPLDAAALPAFVAAGKAHRRAEKSYRSAVRAAGQQWSRSLLDSVRLEVLAKSRESNDDDPSE